MTDAGLPLQMKKVGLPLLIKRVGLPLETKTEVKRLPLLKM
jgi:hypothetical protein